MNPEEDSHEPSSCRSPAASLPISFLDHARNQRRFGVYERRIGIQRHVQRFSGFVHLYTSSLDKSLQLPMEQRNEPAASSAGHNGCAPSTRRIEPVDGGHTAAEDDEGGWAHG